MQKGLVQSARSKRLRPSRSGPVSPEDQHASVVKLRRVPDRTSHHAVSSRISVATAADQHTRPKGRRAARTASGARSASEERKAQLDASISSVSRRTVGTAVNAPRSHTSRSKSGHSSRMGAAQRLRPRGGATHPCPLCSHSTRVLRTTKVNSSVQRHRRCLHCHHEYLTTERARKP